MALSMTHLEDVAKAAGIDPERLADTVKSYTKVLGLARMPLTEHI